MGEKKGMCLRFSQIIADSDWLITPGMKINIWRSCAENPVEAEPRPSTNKEIRNTVSPFLSLKRQRLVRHSR